MLGSSDDGKGKRQEEHRLDCLARYWVNLLKTGQVTRLEVEEWLHKKQHSEAFVLDMRNRLNQQRKLLKTRGL